MKIEQAFILNLKPHPKPAFNKTVSLEFCWLYHFDILGLHRIVKGSFRKPCNVSVSEKRK